MLGPNRLYIQMINDPDGNNIELFFAMLVEMNPKKRLRKRYLWNLLRGRGFYTALAKWTVENVRFVEDCAPGTITDRLRENMDLIHDLALQDGRRAVFRSFVWNVTKHAPILTMDFVPLLSAERVHNILSTKAVIYSDEATQPFVDEILGLRRSLQEKELECQKLLETLSSNL